MAFVAGNGKVQVALTFSQGDGELAENVFGVDTGADGPVSSANLIAIASTFSTWFGTGDGSTHSYKSLMQSSSSLLSVRARDMTTSDAGEYIADVDISGTDGGGKLPQGLTFALTARSGLTGRSNRGRTFLVGMTDNFCNTGQLDVADAGHANSAVSAFTALIDAVSGLSGMSLAILSRTTGGAPRSELVAVPITSYGYHDLFMDYQRRRAPGHNRHH